MTTNLLLNLQEHLDRLNCASHKGDKAEIERWEDAVIQAIGKDLTLVYVDNIGEYGIFSAYEPYLEEEEEA